MTRTLAAFALATGVALSSLSVAHGVTAHAHQRPTLPACKYEDGSGQRGACVWDGGRDGNGVGLSYIVTRDKHFVYVRESVAHALRTH